MENTLTQPQSHAEFLKQHTAMKRHERWLRRVRKHLPDWAARVFALRGRLYDGCGFHYDLERQLGNAIKAANGFEEGWTVGDRVRRELVVEQFMASLIAAERSATSLTDKWPPQH